MEISKEKALEIINERVNQISQATNMKELINFEYFAHGSAVTMWDLGIFTQTEHTKNYDKIRAITNKKGEEL